MSITQKAYQQQQEQLELALAIMKTNHPFSYTDYSMIQWIKGKGTSYSSPYDLIAARRQLQLDFVQPSDGTLRNPHNLTANQVGAGYRLVTQYEAENNIYQEYAEIWYGHISPIGWNKFSCTYMRDNIGASIRVPVSCPITTGTAVPAPPSNIEYQNTDKLPSAGFGYRFATKFEVANNIHQDQAEFFSYNKEWSKFKYSTMSQNFGCTIRVPQSCIMFIEPVVPVVVAPIPLEASDIRIGSAVRHPDWTEGEYETISAVYSTLVKTCTSSISYKTLMNAGWLICYPDSEAWKPCNKLPKL